MEDKHGKGCECQECMEAAKEMGSDIYPKNGGTIHQDDMPRVKVKREDGLPTVDDLSELMGKGKEDEGEDESSEISQVGKMIEIILKIK